MHDYLISLDIFEFLIWILYVLICLGFIYVYKSFNSNKYTKYLLPAFLIKVFGGLLFTLVYIYYYKEGDCNYYYFGSKELVNVFYEDMFLFFDIVKLDNLEAEVVLKNNNYSIFGIGNSETWFLMRLLSPFNILAFNSYLGLTFFTSLISFISSYRLYVLMNKIILNSEKKLFFFIFAIPSVTFWGGGVMKDTFTLAALYFLIVQLYKVVFEKKIKYLIYMLLPAFIIMNLKVYILISFLPWIMFTLFLYFINKSKNPVAKFIIIPYLVIVLFGSMALITSNILSSTVKYQTEQIEDRIVGFKDWHNKLGGSSYDLGELDFTFFGIIKKIPQAINVTLFRPFPWEAGNVMALFNSLESFVIMVFTIVVVLKIGIREFFRTIYKNSFLFGGFIFVLFLAFVLGFTSYNFGALSRFKIPIIPMYLIILYYIYNAKKEKLDIQDL